MDEWYYLYNGFKQKRTKITSIEAAKINLRGKKGLSYSNKRVTIQCVVVDILESNLQCLVHHVKQS